MPSNTTLRQLTLDASCEIHAAADNGTKRGTFSGVVYSGGSLRLAAWYGPVVIDLDGLQPGENIGVLADHSPTIMALLGSASVTVSEGRVLVAGRIVPGTPQADRALAFAEAGMHVPLSIGATPLRIETVKPGVAVTVNGKNFTGPIDVVRASKIDEISLVGLGADSSAFAQIAANRRDPMPRVQPDTEETTDPATSPAIAERDRIQAIRAAFRCLDTAEAARACDQLIESGASVEEADRVSNRLQLAMIRASRPSINGIRGSGGSSPDRDVLTAAVLAHGGASDIAARHFKPDALERADTLRARAGSILGIARESLRTAGRPEPRSQHELIQAAFSTDALGGILQSAISIVALDAFRTSDEPWRAFAHRTPLHDFKTASLTRMGGSFRFQPVGPGGELKHAHLDGETTPIKLGTHGAIVTVSRENIINDTASQLIAQIPRELAREASRVVGDSLAILLTDAGGTFFTEARGNLWTGADMALSIDSLSFVIAKLRTQRDGSGRALNLAPSHLLVGAALESRARAILNSSEIAGVTDENTPSGNPVKGAAELLVDARLGDTEWFLFAKPANAAAVVGTLNGADNATVEAKEPPADLLGATWRAYFDFGVALHEWRAVAKAIGE